MSKINKILLVVLVVVIIAAAAFFLLKKKPGATGKPAGMDPNDLSNNNLPPVTGGNGSVPSLATNPIAPSGSGGSGGLLAGLFGAGLGLGNPMSSGNLTGGALGNTNAGNAVTALTNAVSANAKNFPLRSGSRGNEVKTIQAAANQSISKGQIRSAILTVDGIWGPKTDQAVKQIFPAGVISFELYQSIAGRAAKGQGLK